MTVASRRSVESFNGWMISKRIGRDVIGDRIEGLQYNPDGSLTVFLQHDRPKQGTSNWLPIPEGHFMLVMRLYEPSAAALDHRWVPPIIEPLE